MCEQSFTGPITRAVTWMKAAAEKKTLLINTLRNPNRPFLALIHTRLHLFGTDHQPYAGLSLL